MNTVRARTIVAEIVAGRKRWGRQMSTPYTLDTLYDALVALYEEGMILDDETKEELTKLRRQLAAANARVAKVNKNVKAGDNDNTGD